MIRAALSDFAAPSAPSADLRRANDRAVGLWLLGCAAMVFAMAVIGAITRLTESGLSIMEWAPVSGALPPLSEAEWQRLFALYRQTPEYQEINAGMSLAAFKTIFWWEYVHRLWGRLIGIVFLLPFLWFLLTRRLRPSLTGPLLGLFLLGGLQGALGWFMVASGFAERTDVSQYRLTAHLLLAVAIYAALLWIAFALLAPDRSALDAKARALRRASIGFLGLLLVTIASGALVAGLNAGLIYNSFPLMGGDWVPADYRALESWWLNAFENPTAAQLHHRVLAVLTTIAALGLCLWTMRFPPATTVQRALLLLGIVTLAQFGLGVATLLAVVPVGLGALHQAGALLLLTAALWALSRLRPPAAG